MVAQEVVDRVLPVARRDRIGAVLDIDMLRALGLGKIGSTNTLPDRPEIRGMIARVPHLLEVSDSAGGADDSKES